MVSLTPKKDFHPARAAVLGSTGSVGTQSLEVIRELGVGVEMLAAGENTELLARQIEEFSPKIVAVSSSAAAMRLKENTSGYKIEIIYKNDEVTDAVAGVNADIIIHSVSGLAGLDYAIAAAKSGKRIGMANKEAIIAAGDMIFDSVRQSGGEVIPVDSEHSAIYRCLEGRDIGDVKRIILTASGGPFFGMTKSELEAVDLSDTLKHPTWRMGKKITVDSATLMNKGFEIIEAVRLFGLPEDKVDVIVHRQSIIHSLVEYNDSTFMAQMGKPDMKDCIRYAFTAPHTAKVMGGGIDLTEISKLTFEKPDGDAFPLLGAARDAIRLGGTASASLIAADEEAVGAFIAGRIRFCEIARYVTETMKQISIAYDVNTASIREAGDEARTICRGIIG